MKKPEDEIKVGDVVYVKELDKVNFLRFYELKVVQKKVQATSYIYQQTGKLIEETETEITVDGKEELTKKDSFDFSYYSNKMNPTWAEYFDSYNFETQISEEDYKKHLTIEAL